MEKKEGMVEQEETLETTIAQIEMIIRQMERENVTLEQSFQLYQKGIEKLKNCNLMLDEVEKKMQILNQNGTLSDF